MTSEPPAGAGPISDRPCEAVVSGRRLGVYQVYERLGAGGMGEVYRAHDTRLDRDVAIKILPRAFMADGERLVRFEREARLLAALNHPNIATVHGVEETGGTRMMCPSFSPGRGGADLGALDRRGASESCHVIFVVVMVVTLAHSSDSRREGR